MLIFDIELCLTLAVEYISPLAQVLLRWISMSDRDYDGTRQEIHDIRKKLQLLFDLVRIYWCSHK